MTLRNPVTEIKPVVLCNPNHYDWIDSSKQKRTCQEYSIKKYCLESGKIGKKWKKEKKFDQYSNFGYTAFNCPQCGCGKQKLSAENTDFVEKPKCESFSLWHKMNVFKMRNYYIGTYHRLKNAKFAGHSVYKLKAKMVYAINDGTAWLLTDLFQGSFYQFKFSF